MKNTVLLQRQWDGYSPVHRNKANLYLHLLAVPLFMLGTMVALDGFLMRSGLSVSAGIAGIMVSLFLQGRGHQRELVQPEPFTGLWDFISRIVAEQWITFPRFLATGGWIRNLSFPKHGSHAGIDVSQSGREDGAR